MPRLPQLGRLGGAGGACRNWGDRFSLLSVVQGGRVEIGPGRSAMRAKRSIDRGQTDQV